VKADARLALPVLTAWAAGIAIIVPSDGAVFATMPGAAQAATITLAGWFAASASLLSLTCILVARYRTAPPFVPVLAVASLMTLALCISILMQTPTHVFAQPWRSDLTDSYPWFLSWAHFLRQTFSEAASALPGVGGQLVPGLAIGNTAGVSEGLETAMKAVSLTHITAVSGANCVIVTASIMLVGAKLGFSRTWRVVVAIAALALFVVLVTPQASVVRAAVMSTVVLITLAVGRPGTGLPLLSFAVLLMLLFNPWWAIDFGFILSVFATAGLLVLSRPLAQSLARFMPQLLAMLIAVPLAAQLVCQPVIILLQPQIPTYGVLANVIATPAAPLATVTGLIACLLLPVWAPLGTFMLWVSWIPSQWIGQTAMVIAGLPSPSLAWLAGPLGVALAILTSVVLLLTLLHPRTVVRRLCGVSVFLGCALYVATAAVGGLVFSSRIPSDWVIAACDVGQGDAVLVRDGDQIALFDTGRRPEPLATCLSHLGISRINLLVLTHYDLDHVGGVAATIGKVDRTLLGTPQNAEEKSIVEDLVAGGATVERGDKGDHGSLGAASWQVLWPAPGNPLMQDGNPGSITVRIDTPQLSAIFLGDLGEAAQNALLRESDVAAVDVVKVAHHGSGDQSAALYRKLQASVGIVSVGKENGYGHPTAKTLSLLTQAGTSVLRTDTQGLVIVRASENSLTLWAER